MDKSIFDKISKIYKINPVKRKKIIQKFTETNEIIPINILIKIQK
jgi:5'-3' exonuclease